jgi:hypothetical protein
VHPRIDDPETRRVIPSDYPVAYVYVHWTSADGQGYVNSYVASHDGAKQAAEEAIRAMSFDPLPTGIHVREIEVFTGGTPRRFFHEPVVRRTFGLKET